MVGCSRGLDGVDAVDEPFGESAGLGDDGDTAGGGGFERREAEGLAGAGGEGEEVVAGEEFCQVALGEAAAEVDQVLDVEAFEKLGNGLVGDVAVEVDFEAGVASVSEKCGGFGQDVESLTTPSVDEAGGGEDAEAVLLEVVLAWGWEGAGDPVGDDFEVS